MSILCGDRLYIKDGPRVERANDAKQNKISKLTHLPLTLSVRGPSLYDPGIERTKIFIMVVDP